MWRIPCLTVLPVVSAATYIYADRPVSRCQSQKLGTTSVDPSAQLKLVQVVFRYSSINAVIFRVQHWNLVNGLLQRCLFLTERCVPLRHGARSPLTKRYWEGQQWDVCGKAFEPVKLEIRSLDGGEQPVSGHDQAQVNTAFVWLAFLDHRCSAIP